jgi:beta-lysine 5,6-aminomutase beta subunit
MSSGLYSTKVKNFSTKLDLTHLKPYGDTMNDGKVQVSFTLPVKDDDRSMEAARQLAVKMGLEDAQVSYHGALDKEFTFYVVYGNLAVSVSRPTKYKIIIKLIAVSLGKKAENNEKTDTTSATCIKTEKPI